MNPNIYKAYKDALLANEHLPEFVTDDRDQEERTFTIKNYK